MHATEMSTGDSIAHWALGADFAANSVQTEATPQFFPQIPVFLANDGHHAIVALVLHSDDTYVAIGACVQIKRPYRP